MSNVEKLKTKMQCSICSDTIGVEPVTNWAYGHNAQPINDGRCCTECNNLVVIPTRIRRMRIQTKES